MGTHHPLTDHQRYQVYALKKAGHDQQCIYQHIRADRQAGGTPDDYRR